MERWILDLSCLQKHKVNVCGDSRFAVRFGGHFVSVHICLVYTHGYTVHIRKNMDASISHSLPFSVIKTIFDSHDVIVCSVWTFKLSNCEILQLLWRHEGSMSSERKMVSVKRGNKLKNMNSFSQTKHLTSEVTSKYSVKKLYTLIQRHYRGTAA